MPVTINGNGSISGLSVGGLGAGVVNTATLADGAATGVKQGAGSVIQVVQATQTSEVSTTGTSFVDTGLSGSITPSSNSSKILVIVTQRFFIERSTDQARGGFRLLRGSTVILQGPNTQSGSEPGGEGFSSGNGPSAIQFAGAYSCSFLDSPSTTSATTYKTQFANNQSSASPTIYINSLNNNSGEDGVSTITLMEIKQ